MIAKPPRKLLADLVRMPRVEEISADEVKENNKEDDLHFIKLYQRYRLGKLVATATRIEISRILPGVFVRTTNGEVVQRDHEAEQRHIEWQSHEIRQGQRPVLFLYNGIFGDSKGKFVCSDDVLAYHGYRNLGVVRVPAILLGKHHGSLGESGICTRGSKNLERVMFDSTVAASPSPIQSFFGDYDDFQKLKPLDVIQRLKRETDNSTSRVALFHCKADSEDEIHYHHTLHSVAYRLGETLDAIALLLKHDMPHQIRPLVRSAYDLFLNFYIDWLWPEKIGPLLQAIAILKRAPQLDAEVSNLRSVVDRTYGGLAKLCTNAAEKGRLSPLGSILHQRIYSSLSPIVHQDFGVTLEYSAILDTGAPQAMQHSEIMENIRWLDVIVAATVTRDK